MMKSVQVEKIHETIEILFKYHHQKVLFMKQNIPIQQQLIKKIEETSQLSLSAMGKLENVVKQQKQTIASQIDSYQRLSLYNREQFKLNDKKNPTQEFGPQDWNRNLTRVLQSMSISHAAKLNGLKIYIKVVDACLQELQKQSMMYRVDIKNFFKELNTLFEGIDAHQKQQNKILTKLSKESKSRQLKESIYFLTEVKRVENFLYKQIDAFLERNKKILELVKLVVKNQKRSSKKIKQVLATLFQKKKDVFKQLPQDQKLLGLLTVMQDGVQESRQLYLQKTLISPALQQKLSWMVSPQKSRVHHMMKYLSIPFQQLRQKHDFFNNIRILSANISFKNFSGVSLAQGWLITSYTPSIAYLTFDHFLVIFDMNGSLLKKIHSSSSKINKIGDNNVVYLEETKKGFFSDSKQEYQLKFDNQDRMEQFILFMQNQIS